MVLLPSENDTRSGFGTARYGKGRWVMGWGRVIG